MPQQRIARTESRLCGGAFTAAFQRLKRENSGIQLSALCYWRSSTPQEAPQQRHCGLKKIIFVLIVKKQLVIKNAL
jgi:hypothetical protein